MSRPQSKWTPPEKRAAAVRGGSPIDPATGYPGGVPVEGEFMAAALRRGVVGIAFWRDGDDLFQLVMPVESAELMIRETADAIEAAKKME